MEEKPEHLMIALDLNSHFWMLQKKAKSTEEEVERNLPHILKILLQAINVHLTMNHDNKISFYVFNYDLKFLTLHLS